MSVYFRETWDFYECINPHYNWTMYFHFGWTCARCVPQIILYLSIVYTKKIILYYLVELDETKRWTLASEMWAGKMCFMSMIKKINDALADMAQWIEHLPENQRVIVWIPSQSTCLGSGPGPQQMACKRQPHTLMFLSISFSLSSPLFKIK